MNSDDRDDPTEPKPPAEDPTRRSADAPEPEDAAERPRPDLSEAPDDAPEASEAADTTDTGTADESPEDADISDASTPDASSNAADAVDASPAEDSSPTTHALEESTEDSSPTTHALEESTEDSSPTTRALEESTEDSSPTTHALEESTEDSSPTTHALEESTEDSSPTTHEATEDSSPTTHDATEAPIIIKSDVIADPADDDEPLDTDDPLAAALAELDGPRRPAPAGVHLSDELPIDPEDDLRGVEGEASLRLVSILESLLFAAARPLKVNDLRKLLAETSKHQIQLALAHLMAITRDRGIVLAQVAGGFQFRTHPDNAAWVQRMLQTKPARLSRTQIETLAIVAYRQPITRPEIDEVRGVDSGAVLKGLLERELVQIVGKKEEPGRPLLYGTTVRFLEFFNLRGLRDLPTLRDFRDLSEESKATLRTQLGASEAEALGQGVLGFPTVADEGADMHSSEVQSTSQSPEGPGSLPDGGPIEAPGNPSPAEIIPPEPESLPGPSPDEIRPPSPGTDSPDSPDEIRLPSPDIADVPHDPRPAITDAPSDPGPEIGPGGGGGDTGSGTPSEI